MYGVSVSLSRKSSKLGKFSKLNFVHSKLFTRGIFSIPDHVKFSRPRPRIFKVPLFNLLYTRPYPQIILIMLYHAEFAQTQWQPQLKLRHRLSPSGDTLPRPAMACELVNLFLPVKHLRHVYFCRNA